MTARQRSLTVQQPPEWGIEPVPPDLRRLGFLDQAVLWGNLGVSLLVLVAGALLVPALGLWPALAATVVGAVIGNALLGLAAVPAAATGVPAMVLYRAPLGVRGSLLPTACNVVQNLGWATFELFVIATAATAISERVFGVGGRPLWVADYARFGRSAGATFWGTAVGYLLAQVWFFALGVLFLLSIGQGDVIAALLAVPVGLLAMAVLVVDETDEVFANLYSAGVSLKNAAPRLPGRRVALALGAIATLAAALVDDLARYENFLFLLGALFVPLFGVLAADWYVLARRRYDVEAMYRADGPYGGVRWPAVLVWLLGFLVYNWINPGTVTAWVSLVEGLFDGLLGLPFPLSARLPWLGASIPAFAVAFLAMLAVGRRPRKEAPA
jgi:purine-cytosine permease-like protein